ATFMVLAPEHPLAKEICRGTPYEAEVLAFIERMRREDKIVRAAPDTEKEGVFTGSYAINPLTYERIPIFLANFVLLEYGTGAIMAVPAHDQRDFEFAKKYDLPIRVVIQPPGETLHPETMEKAYEGEGIMVDSGPFTNLESRQGKEAVVAYLEEHGIGRRAINYRLRDWGISRQRYWGTPIPIIFCDSCGIVPVPDEDLPVILPMNVEITLTGGSPLQKVGEFVNAPCPRCQGPAKRETDTMDTFVDSSWYFLRFTSPRFTNGPFDREAARYWMAVDQYIGGIEHAVLHLLYARFFTKVLRDLGLVQVGEPFLNLLTQGMVCKETYRCLHHGYRLPEEVDELKRCRECLQPVEVGRTEKMSKSKRNVVDPDDLLEKYGADTIRLFCLFAAPPEKDLEWSDQGVEGSFRFLNRVWRLVEGYKEELKKPVLSIPFHQLTVGKALFRKTHQTIKKVGEDIEHAFHFNTAIAALMELVNEISDFNLNGDPNTREEKRFVLQFAIKALLLMLAPFAPHLSEELWQEIGHQRSIFEEPWPSYDPAGVQAEELTVIVQVDGKLRSKLLLPAEASEETLKRAALEDPKIRQWLKDKKIKRVVVVPKKLVNIVTS
ncbi:MAG: leucine--tRNA ligase, partial [Candidatus Methylomirabilales bacterium]